MSVPIESPYATSKFQVEAVAPNNHSSSQKTRLSDLSYEAVSHIQYVAPTWSGMSSAADRARLDSLLRHGKRLGYCSNDVPTVTELFSSADYDFFHSVKTNSTHVLQPYLPDETDISYRLRTRPHNIND